ncbi:MAG: glycosyltransferase family 4 protein [Anaerolineae bacterium]
MSQSLDYPSGLGRYWPLAKELAHLGHQVTMLCLHPNFAACSPRAFDHQGVHVEYVAQMHVRGSGSERGYYSPLVLPLVAGRSLVAMSRALRHRRPDACHIAKAQPINGLATLAKPNWWRRGMVYLDCDDYEAASNNFQSNWQRSIVATVEDGLCRRAHAITTNTTFTVNRLRALGVSHERIFFVPNGVDRERVRAIPPELPAQLRRQHDLEGKPLLAYVGSLSLTNHAVDLLLQAFAMAHGERPDLRLALVGGGEDWEKLRALAANVGIGNAVRFVGRVGSIEAMAWLATADLVADPARDDPAHCGRAPLKIVEAMAVGTAVLTSDVGDRRATIGDGKAGFLAPAGDSDALAEAILAAFADGEQLYEKGHTARELVESYYWDQLVQRFLSVYTMA